MFEEIDIIGSKFHFYQGKTPKKKNNIRWNINNTNI